jgi:hypothetical protein
MRTVILYGNSLSVSSVGASLSECAGWNIMTVSADGPDPIHGLIELQPDVVIFDLTATQPSFAIALLRTKPGLLLVGVDLQTDMALVLSSETARILTSDDLLRVIQRHPAAAAAHEQEEV